MKVMTVSVRQNMHLPYDSKVLDREGHTLRVRPVLQGAVDGPQHQAGLLPSAQVAVPIDGRDIDGFLALQGFTTLRSLSI